MTYRLIALDDDTPTRTVGRYPDYETALQARIADVIDQLRANDGWCIGADHLIIGPGVDGPETRHPLCTVLGFDVGGEFVPTDEDIEQARRWLLRAHDLESRDRY